MSSQKSRPSHDGEIAAAIGKSTFFGVLASGAQIGTRLITVPVVIHHLGLDGSGIWSIIMVTAAYMRFGSAGVKSAFQKYVAEATETGSFADARRLISTGSIAMLAISLFALLPVAFFAPFLASAASIPKDFLHSAAASITVLASIYAVSNFGAGYEAIVMGAHRVDLTRKYNTALTVCEAIAIVAVLRAGHGLLAMTLVMGTSELIYIGACYRASLRVLPQVRILASEFSWGAFPELFRFAGSYQLVNVLELLYTAVLPIFVLKFFGAGAAGMFALSGRVVQAALTAQDALVLPILSGGSAIFASGSTERIRRLLATSFKATLAAALPALAFVAAFGNTLVYAWTGETDSRFQTTIWWIAMAALLKAISLLQLILYRASGQALLDNIRQLLRIAVIAVTFSYGARIGFDGVLAGMVAAELVGVIFMFFAMSTALHAFDGRALALDALKISAATAVMLVGGASLGLAPVPWSAHGRVAAVLKLGELALGCLIATWPALALTGVLSVSERRTLWHTFRHRSSAVAA